MSDPVFACETGSSATDLGWEQLDIEIPGLETPCGSGGWVRYSERYGMWVGAVLCSSTRYKLVLGCSRDGAYYQIGDRAGNGQDHCELVNADFTIPNEDDITSGCSGCAQGQSQNPVGTVGWSRSHFGESFQPEPVWPDVNVYTTLWYECAVAIPGP